MRSPVVDAWIEEGRVEGRVEAQVRIILRQATRKFGASPAHISQIQQIEDSDRLERIAEAILDAHSWDELLKVA